MSLTIVEGSTFCICDELGDLDGGVHGLYACDTRFLTTFALTVEGHRPLLLSSGTIEHFSAAFYSRNAPVEGLPQDALSIARRRFVGRGLQDHVAVRNETGSPLSFTLALDCGTDFADIISVKEHEFALGDPPDAPRLPPPAHARHDEQERRVVLEEAEARGGRTQVVLSRAGQGDQGAVRFRVDLPAHGTWDLRVDVAVSLEGELEPPDRVERRLAMDRARARSSLDAWSHRAPRLSTTWDELRHSIDQSVSDLAALRLRHGDGKPLPAAGMPWFMAVFGRDTIVTSLQSMLLGPELAASALEALADLQADADDPTIDAEPGKIIHELRTGRAADSWFARYYGTVDATPLYPVLLSEVWRWSGDAELARRFREPALAALAWIDVYGDRDGDGFVEYERRSHGLENQSWKDSGDSQRFHDGRVAEPPIAPVEVQGYVYDAKRRLAEVAREAWGDRELAERLEREAAELRARFDEAFWVAERGGYYALALDGNKERVDALCSNIGHLLWSGIVPEERVDAVADALMRDELWSGWGIRTMSTQDAAYSPLGYHTGTVWPHDTALAAWGLARYGRWDEARRVAVALLEAAGHFGWSLPEAFAGFDRTETPFPIAYPTAARPQAWAAGTPLLLLRLLLGLEPVTAERRLGTLRGAKPLDGVELSLEGVRALGRSWDVSWSRGSTRVEPSPILSSP
ncbi:glycogen debranching N-terminal domain-containing protein [Gaiella sp.]|uniref:amylo-alpha-1,6-glucosidase n=1 Tax=Gaiella sp. TaxID=2663207 RepID=UPI002E314787|nr:glycogen debranching N-terminal domain-containing protein [Gaiella sp.]HEX5582964.1 glycogen debranching N-terminal domain-containing protein [Gaiella sp.]